ncbi:MAG: hypothetical protein GY822_12985 [Deltaproteobacteria bacterium]|nr:hypothetical protein [Deltaproteobacteria bacterium]
MNADTESLFMAYLYGELSAEAQTSFESRLSEDGDLRADLAGFEACLELIDNDMAFGESSWLDIPPAHLQQAIFRQEALERPQEIRHAALEVRSPQADSRQPWLQRVSTWVFGSGTLALGAVAVMFFTTSNNDEAPSSDILSEMKPSVATPVSAGDDAKEEKSKKKSGEKADRKSSLAKLAKASFKSDGEDQAEAPSVRPARGAGGAPTGKAAQEPRADANSPKNLRENMRKRSAATKGGFSDKNQAEGTLSEELLAEAERRQARLLSPAEKQEAQKSYQKRESKAADRKPAKKARRSKKDMAYDELSGQLGSQSNSQMPPGKLPASLDALSDGIGFGAEMALNDESDADESAAESDDDTVKERAGDTATRSKMESSPRKPSPKPTAQSASKGGKAASSYNARSGPPKLSRAAKSKANRLRRIQKTKSSKKSKGPNQEERNKTSRAKSDEEVQLILATALREMHRGNAIEALDLFRRAEVKDRTHHAGVIPVVGQMRALEAMRQPQRALRLLPRIRRAKRGTEGVPDGLEVGARIAEQQGDLPLAKQLWRDLLVYKAFKTKAKKNIKRLTRKSSDRFRAMESDEPAAAAPSR